MGSLQFIFNEYVCDRDILVILVEITAFHPGAFRKSTSDSQISFDSMLISTNTSGSPALLVKTTVQPFLDTDLQMLGMFLY